MERRSEELYKMEGFYRQKEGNSGSFQALVTFGDGRGLIRDYVASADQVILG